MHLSEYIKKTGITFSSFAEVVDYNRIYISQVMNGKKPITEKFLMRVSRVTMGLVCSRKDIVIKKKPEMKRKRRKVKPPMSFKELMENPRISNDLPESWGKIKGDDY